MGAVKLEAGDTAVGDTLPATEPLAGVQSTPCNTKHAGMQPPGAGKPRRSSLAGVLVRSSSLSFQNLAQISGLVFLFMFASAAHLDISKFYMPILFRCMGLHLLCIFMYIYIYGYPSIYIYTPTCIYICMCTCIYTCILCF